MNDESQKAFEEWAKENLTEFTTDEQLWNAAWKAAMKEAMKAKDYNYNRVNFEDTPF